MAYLSQACGSSRATQAPISPANASSCSGGIPSHSLQCIRGLHGNLPSWASLKELLIISLILNSDTLHRKPSFILLAIIST